MLNHYQFIWVNWLVDQELCLLPTHSLLLIDQDTQDHDYIHLTNIKYTYSKTFDLR